MALGAIEHATRWKVLRVVARGGMGTVYEALQLGAEGFEKRVALKVLNESFSADLEHRRLLVAEAKLCANLVHENIVQIYQLVEHEGHFVVVMELCDGVTVRDFAERHQKLGVAVDVDMAAFIASRACRALQYAHELTDVRGRPLGIVHRDVCPSNLLMTRGGVVKLGDFGIAKVGIGPNREGHVVMGKARYMSPEQASFQPTDGRSDLFSLGVVLYEVLTGEALFAAPTPLEAMTAVRERTIPKVRDVRSDVPEALAAIIDYALVRDPERRCRDARSMAHQLEYFVYQDGLGPTSERLKDYLAELFPELAGRGNAPSADDDIEPTVAVPAPKSETLRPPPGLAGLAPPPNATAPLPGQGPTGTVILKKKNP